MIVTFAFESVNPLQPANVLTFPYQPAACTVSRYPQLSLDSLRSYFLSGWAFLIPYLAAYLLYAWLDWSVNPPSSGPQSPATGILPPSLLHLYWVLHAVHLVLGFVVLASLWRGRCETKDQSEKSIKDGQAYTDSSMLPPPSSGVHLSSTRYLLLATLPKAMPWLLLGFLFYIPGIYFEWPSDPWEHLRRINEWHAHDIVTAHSTWRKFSYFLPYSLTSQTIGLVQLGWLNLYYTAACLLLSWQYYRLARAVGLGERTSLLFVFLNALTFGNNIFSFYRYYGLSSSILAQLGAVAMARIALEELRGNRETETPRPRAQDIGRPIPHDPSASGAPSRLFCSGSGLLQSAGAGLFLFTLIAFNHVQGLGLAGISLLAVVVWKLLECRRSFLLWLIAAALVMSFATVLWFPRSAEINEFIRQGWLTPIYSFNLFSSGSPAWERSLQVLGIIGCINILAGLWLVARFNHVVGWLTLLPPSILILPCFALPFAHVLTAGGVNPANIVAFHRMLLAVPTGLAIVTALQFSTPHAARRSESRLRKTLGPLATLATLFALVSFEGLSWHRLWHTLQITPHDLQLRGYIGRALERPGNPATDENLLTIDIPLASEARETFHPDRRGYALRQPAVVTENKRLSQHLDWLANWDLSRGQPSFTNDAPEARSPGEGSFIRPAAELARTLAMPFSANDGWVLYGGHPPQRVVRNGGPALISPTGEASEVFTRELIPISPAKRYRLSTTIRQVGAPEAIQYLAVAWFDHDARHLPSNASAPTGAGEPAGWTNGTYSYYGLAGQPARQEETRHVISFGYGELASIPDNAGFIRIGALLNYRSTPQSAAELSAVLLEAKPLHSRLIFDVLGYQQLISPASQAAQLSGHWSAQQVPAAQAGTQDLHTGLARLIAAP